MLQKGYNIFAEKMEVNQEKKSKNRRNFLTSYSHCVVRKF